jgi:beta-glucosidase
MSRLVFPEGFQWGTATAAYQIEGAVKQGGRGESIWDRFCQMPGNILHNDTGNVACDHYHLYKEDVALMKSLGHNAYRFSIAWSRIMPTGRGEVNKEGIAFYSGLIDELLAAGIEPYVTIYHWDLPQALQDIGGWLNADIVNYFEDYCKVVFDSFGGRVRNWITLNEPFCIANLGYLTGEHAPGYHDLASSLRASYYLALSHGHAVLLFRKMKLPGEIGITLNMGPSYPLSDSEQDKLASRYMDGFCNRWFLDPIFKGTFPADMIELYKSRGITLPDFKKEELAICSQKNDFLGINYYSSSVVRYNKDKGPFNTETVRTELPHTDREWTIDPQAFTDILVRLNKEYDVPKFYITENGASYNDIVDMDGKIEDNNRIDYLRRHFIAAHNAIKAGVDIRGYFIWSLYDNFEWAYGRYSRFGIVYNDFDTQKRTVKKSGYWFKDVIHANAVEG